ncbi:hypothetical protein, conserved [Leishmania tarentolae]|uniref:EGF-like domain-containing protein n=1 Tax=Leishmania tarentolae TaxID=5689 RepID=A0A640KPG9_LEITA|nr:hypothetical protein, conserved [Leishmania tarentolae]
MWLPLRSAALWSLWLVATVLCVSSGWAGSASVVNYTVSSVTRSELTVLPYAHWAQYQTICGSPTATQTWYNTSFMRFYFPPLSPAGTSATFYAWEKTSWYVSDMGFLSPTPYGMCKGFCEKKSYATLQGNYAFSDNMSALYEGGGDWPMIAFYAVPFAFSGGDPSHVRITTHDSNAGGGVRAAARQPTSSSAQESRTSQGNEEYTTVEYCSAPVAGATDPAQAALTAQVSVYTNGTIIMRYASLPDTSMLPEYMPSTGLIYSKTLRTVVPAPTRANGIAAYRFEPVFDVCAGHDDVSLCTADTANDCVWCSSTSACCASTVAAEVCPRGQWTTPASSKAAFPPQQFYDVTVDFDIVWYNFSSLYRDLSTAKDFPMVMGWKSVLFASHTSSYLECSPGVSCTIAPEKNICNPIAGMCPNGNYTLSILGMESKMVWGADAKVIFALTSTEPDGTPLCNTQRCAEGFVMIVNGTLFQNGNMVSPTFTVQLYLDSTGVVDLVIQVDKVPTGTPLLAYPPIRVGLVRYGVDDASSVMIPQGLLRSGLHARFVPKSGCEDCGLNGWCDELSGTCQCRPGYYGSRCVACPVCWTGSECDDGISGSGACMCDGGACEAACANTSSGGVPSRSCVGCNAVGGRCNCGVCECRDGWSGDGCSDAPADACRAYSFDGCEVCGQHEGCVFCHDSTCFNPALSGTRDGYTCSYSTPAADKQACVTYKGLEGVSVVLSVQVTIGLFVLIAVLATMLFVSVRVLGYVFWSHGRPDRITVLAVGGTLDFVGRQEQRQVMEASFIRARLPERQMMGIPLKQVSLRRLFKRRAATVERDML